MPNDAVLIVVIQFFFDGFRGKDLRITHHMLFQMLDAVIVCSFHICQAIAQQEQQPIFAEKRSQHPMGRCHRAGIGLIIRRGFNGDQIGVSQNFRFDRFIQRSNTGEDTIVFLPEVAEE